MGTQLNPWLYDKIKDKKVDENKLPAIYPTDINDFAWIISQVKSIGWYKIEYTQIGWSIITYFDKTPYPSYYEGAIKIHGDFLSPDCCVSNPVNTLQCTGKSTGITSYCVEVGRYNVTNGAYIDENVPDAVLYNMVNSLPVTSNTGLIIATLLLGGGIALYYVGKK